MRRFTLQKTITYEVELVAMDLETAIDLAEMDWPGNWEVVYESDVEFVSGEDDDEEGE